MKEISLFVSICWPSSHTRIPYFGKGGVTAVDVVVAMGAIEVVITTLHQTNKEVSLIHLAQCLPAGI